MDILFRALSKKNFDFRTSGGILVSPTTFGASCPAAVPLQWWLLALVCKKGSEVVWWLRCRPAGQLPPPCMPLQQTEKTRWGK
jgi:hypothetical protein